MARKERKNDRARADVPGRLLGPRGYTRGTVHNLSTGGLFFAGKHINVGVRTELEFELDGVPIHATCEVLYRQSLGEVAGVGVRFLRLDPGDVERIRAFLSGAAAPAGE